MPTEREIIKGILETIIEKGEQPIHPQPIVSHDPAFFLNNVLNHVIRVARDRCGENGESWGEIQRLTSQRGRPINFTADQTREIFDELMRKSIEQTDPRSIINWRNAHLNPDVLDSAKEKILGEKRRYPCINIDRA